MAVVDTGIDFSHPALATHAWLNAGEVAANGRDDDGDGIVDDVHGANFLNRTGDATDTSGHGTHVAGIIAAADPSARIMALKAGDDGWIDDAAAAAAIDYAVGHGARIINLSWASLGGSDGELSRAVAAATARGVLVVSAAGNFATNVDEDPVYPAAYSSESAIAVAATCNGVTLAPFSDYGRQAVALAAPGCDIRSTLPGGSYGSLSGTSMAAAAVSGTAAMLLESHPTATGGDVAHALVAGAQTATGLAGEVASGGVLSLSGAERVLAGHG